MIKAPTTDPREHRAAGEGVCGFSGSTRRDSGRLTSSLATRLATVDRSMSSDCVYAHVHEHDVMNTSPTHAKQSQYVTVIRNCEAITTLERDGTKTGERNTWPSETD